jgi:glycosyltransferase involved in cell wall biosynthesis
VRRRPRRVLPKSFLANASGHVQENIWHMDSAPVQFGHHWLVSMRGGERAFEAIANDFPAAPIHTLIARPAKLSAALRAHPIRQSWLGRLPASERYFRALLGWHPAAARSLKPDADCRLFISSDAAVIKCITLPADVPHVCFCHSPPRYLWDMREEYLRSVPQIARSVFNRMADSARAADRAASARVTDFVSVSRFVRDRIRRFYARDSTVIHPTVAVDDFDPHHAAEDFYLTVSELVPYKRVDLAVEAFNQLGKRLVVIGGGGGLHQLRKLAGPSVQILGPQPFPVLRDHFQRCRALVFPGLEDFGIVMAEAQAAGRPVIAFRGGGALDIVREGETGAYFDDQTPESLVQAIREFEKGAGFSPALCRSNAERFSLARFQREWRGFLLERYADRLPGFAQEALFRRRKVAAMMYASSSRLQWSR